MSKWYIFGIMKVKIFLDTNYDKMQDVKTPYMATYFQKNVGQKICM